MLKNRIPEIEEPKFYTNVKHVPEGFVKISTNEKIDIRMQYPILNKTHAIEDCYLRNEVVNRLYEAQNFLPKGIKLRIWDAWRPFALQKELYDSYSQTIVKLYNLENETADKREQIIKKYISFPNKDHNFPPVHTTGGAVDVTLIKSDGTELDMGTKYDEFKDETSTAFYEKCSEKYEIVRNNRRILYNCMINAGFTNLPTEWWHYDYGDMFWAYYKKTPAIYIGVYTKEGIVEK